MGELLRPWRWVIVAVLFLGALYFATRLTNLTLLPIFTDEAIYIRWSQIGARDANWRFISLTDGKQPLFTWVTMVLLRLFPAEDPLWVGRLTSVLAGAASLVGIATLSFVLFKKKIIAFWAAALYLASPFSLLYDRMALYDSLVATFSIWNLTLAILLVKTLRLDVALILGLTLGAGMLNKTSGFLSLYLLPVTLLLFGGEAKRRWRRLVRWVALVALAAVLSQALYSVLRLSPLLHMVKEKDTLFVYPFHEWIAHPFRFVEGNLRGMLDWFWRYLSLPVVIAAGVGVVRRRITAELLLLFLWWAAPFVALALFGKVLYPRFILFMTLPILVLAAAAASRVMAEVKYQMLAGIVLAILIVPNLHTNVRLIIDPVTAPIPQADLGQYLNDWPAGGGVAEVKDYLQSEAAKGPIAIYTEGTFGLLPYALELYLVDHPNVTIKGIWPLPPVPPQEVVDNALIKPTYLIINQSQIVPLGWSLRLIAEHQKGINPDKKLRLFRVFSPLALTPRNS